MRCCVNNRDKGGVYAGYTFSLWRCTISCRSSSYHKQPIDKWNYNVTRSDLYKLVTLHISLMKRHFGINLYRDRYNISTYRSVTIYLNTIAISLYIRG